MYLNGQPLKLHGASIEFEAPGHGEALGPAEEDTLVQELQAIGANATRSQHPLPGHHAGTPRRRGDHGVAGGRARRPLRRLDGHHARSSPNGRTKTCARRCKPTQLHPSMIAWNLTNEMAGNGHPGGQAQYVEAMSQWLHAYDPGRMVAVDVWGSTPRATAPGRLYSYVDAVSETDYSGWYEGVHYKPTRAAQADRGRLAAMNTTFAGKVQIISEFGAEGNALEQARAPRRLRLPVAPAGPAHPLYRPTPHLSGMLVWVLRDFALRLPPTTAARCAPRLPTSS